MEPTKRWNTKVDLFEENNVGNPSPTLWHLLVRYFHSKAYRDCQEKIERGKVTALQLRGISNTGKDANRFSDILVEVA